MNDHQFDTNEIEAGDLAGEYMEQLCMALALRAHLKAAGASKKERLLHPIIQQWVVRLAAIEPRSLEEAQCKASFLTDGLTACAFALTASAAAMVEAAVRADATMFPGIIVAKRVPAADPRDRPLAGRRAAAHETSAGRLGSEVTTEIIDTLVSIEAVTPAEMIRRDSAAIARKLVVIPAKASGMSVAELVAEAERIDGIIEACWISGDAPRLQAALRLVNDLALTLGAKELRDLDEALQRTEYICRHLNAFNRRLGCLTDMFQGTIDKDCKDWNIVIQRRMHS